MTGVEWTDRTWNPTVGCSPVSPGCEHCYAATFAHRGLTPAHRGLTAARPGGLRLRPGRHGGPAWTGEVRLLADRLDDPLAWRTPCRIFAGSMSDLFHPAVPDAFLAQVFAVMAMAPRHTFQVLTKRPQRAAQLLSGGGYQLAGRHREGQFRSLVAYQAESVPGGDPAAAWDAGWPLPNLWLGTSIESDRFVWRADHVRRTPAAVRWLSLEPLLGPLPSLDLAGIEWVVVGGESGPGARPMHPDWVRDIRDRCQATGTAFLFKQWGTWAPLIPLPAGRRACPDTCMEIATPDGSRRGEMARVGKKAAGRELDGRIWHEFPTSGQLRKRRGRMWEDDPEAEPA